MERQNNRRILISAVVCVLVIVAICSGLLALGSTVLLPEEVDPEHTSKSITKNGIDYFPKQNLTVILLMGIDEAGPVKDSLSYNNQGEADMVVLAVIDETERACRMLTLNRDTMMKIPMLGLGGKHAGSKLAQLALAHTYGSGLEDSCENTCRAVSDFLKGITIDYYISINLDAVAILNDAVGGVTVTVEDDFSLVDDSIKKGFMVLQGNQALSYVQTRWNVGDHLNLSRMERQKTYMQGFMEAFRQKTKETEGFVLNTYESIAPYLVSNLPVSTLSGMVDRYERYAITEFLSLEGENVMGEEYYEFHPDQEKLEDLILELFYVVH